MGDKSEKSKNKKKKQGEAQKKRDEAAAAAKKMPPPPSPKKYPASRRTHTAAVDLQQRQQDARISDKSLPVSHGTRGVG